MPESKEDKRQFPPMLPSAAGIAAGLTTDEASRIPRVAIDALAKILERGMEEYPEREWGQLIDRKTKKRVEKIREAMGAPKTLLVKGPFHATLPQQYINVADWLDEKFPRIGKYMGLDDVKGFFPFIVAKDPNIAAIAHEFGHNIKSPLSVLSIFSPAIRFASVGGGIGAALSENETAQALAPYIAGAGTAPLLLEEGRASAHALRGIAKAEGLKAALGATTRLGPAIGTYATAAIPAIVAPIVAKAVKDYMEGQKKEAAEQKAVQLKTEGRLKSTAPRAWATSGPKPKTSKIGKPGSPPAKPPSKTKFYRDIQRQMSPGSGKREAVKTASAAATAAGIGSSMAWGAAMFPIKNIIVHAMLNTKASPKVIRKFVENIGDEYLRAGFRHALVGKKVSSSGVAGMTSGAVGGAAPMAMYNQGHDYGRKVYEVLDKVPFVKPRTHFKAIRAADKAVKGTMKAAPYLGIAGGTGYGYLTGKTDSETMPLKSIFAGALTGGLVGKGAKHFMPQAPPMKQLDWVRKKVVDPALRGSDSKIGRILDAMAK